MVRKNWTEKEVEFLRENYKSDNIHEVGKKMGRSYNSVNLKASEIGITKPDYWKPYTKEDLEFVKNNYGKVTLKEIAINIKRSIRSIAHMGEKLGLMSKENCKKTYFKKGNKSWNKKNLPEEEIINLYLNKTSPYKICKIYCCSNSVIYEILKKHNTMMFPNGYFIIGKTAWNNGLTRETDERLRIMGDSQRGKIISEDSKIKMRIKMKGRYKNMSYEDRYGEEKAKALKENMRIKMKAKWRDKDFVIKFTKRMCYKPTSPEKAMIDIIQRNNLPFNYVGNGKFWISEFNPDFICLKEKIVLEVYGIYWHNLPNYKKRDIERLEAYKNKGYKTIIFWEDELMERFNKKLSEEQILSRINDYMKGGVEDGIIRKQV